MIWTKRTYGWRQPRLPRRPTHRFNCKLDKIGDLPRRVDWGTKYLGWPAVYDQGQTGSCVGHGCKRVAHTLQIEQGLPTIVEPSALFIYYNARAVEGDVGEDSGAAVADGFASMTTQGWCPESDWPLDPNMVTTTPIPQAYQDALKNIVDQFNPAAVDNTDLQTLLEALNTRPLVGGITCYDSFQSDETINTGVVRLPKKGERVEGGHCMFFRGFDLDAEVVFFDNSWGTGYGVNGTGTIPIAYLTNGDLASDFHMALHETTP